MLSDLPPHLPLAWPLRFFLCFPARALCCPPAPVFPLPTTRYCPNSQGRDARAYEFLNGTAREGTRVPQEALAHRNNQGSGAPEPMLASCVGLTQQPGLLTQPLELLLLCMLFRSCCGPSGFSWPRVPCHLSLYDTCNFIDLDGLPSLLHWKRSGTRWNCDGRMNRH